MKVTAKGTWCSGITPAQHAGGPGFNPQCVHVHPGGATTVMDMGLDSSLLRFGVCARPGVSSLGLLAPTVAELKLSQASGWPEATHGGGAKTVASKRPMEVASTVNSWKRWRTHVVCRPRLCLDGRNVRVRCLVSTSVARRRWLLRSSRAPAVRRAPLLLVLAAAACRGPRLSAAGFCCRRRAPAVCPGLLPPVVGPGGLV